MGDPQIQMAGVFWKSLSRTGLASGFLIAFAPLPAQATNWIVTVGGGVGASPPYEGAGHDVLQPLLTFTLHRADVPYRFVPPDGGSTIALISKRHFVFGPIVRFRYSRDD